MLNTESNRHSYLNTAWVCSCADVRKRVRYRMTYKVPFSVLLVLISGFGFIFAFVTVGSLISFLSYIPSPKVDVSQIHGNFILTDITYCVECL
jgi:hypothetical protein